MWRYLLTLNNFQLLEYLELAVNMGVNHVYIDMIKEEVYQRMEEPE